MALLAAVALVPARVSVELFLAATFLGGSCSVAMLVFVYVAAAEKYDATHAAARNDLWAAMRAGGAAGFDRQVTKIPADQWTRKVVSGESQQFDLLIGKWSFGLVEDVNDLFHSRRGTEGKKNIFNYGNKTDGWAPSRIRSNNLAPSIFPTVLSKMFDYFSFNDCTFSMPKSKESTARISMFN